MTYIWDTNILLYILRIPNFFEILNQKYDFSNPQNKVYISAVSVGEIHAIAFRNRWGIKRKTELVELLKAISTISVTDDETLIEMYAEIDVYSQSQHPSLKLPISA
jgi:predicted nucleic acid-binding protein